MLEEQSINQASPCRSCGGVAFRPHGIAQDFDTGTREYRLDRCAGCDLIRTEPCPSDDELAKSYHAAYYGGRREKFSAVIEHLLIASSNWQAGTLAAQSRNATAEQSEPRRALDVGCGRGLLLNALHRRGFDVLGVERPEFTGTTPDNIPLLRTTLETLELPPEQFDLIVFRHSLEHLSDPASVIQKAASLLKPGGILFVAVPNAASLQARLFRSAWFHWELPRHLHHFTPTALAQLLEKQGFEVKKTGTWSAEQNVYGFIQSALNVLAPRTRQNALFGRLKSTTDANATDWLWAAAAIVLLPLAVLEWLVTGLFGVGATLEVLARKPTKP